MKKVNHHYFVEWSAPNYRNSGHTKVLASNKVEAVVKTKKKLGSKVKKQYLHHFYAFRIK